MYGKDIKKCIEKIPFLRENFDGLFKFENFAINIQERHFVILNKDMINHVGHWVLLLRIDSDTFEMFDSLGAEKKDIKALEKLSSKHVEVNGTRVQGHTSKNCGIYCLYTAFWRLTCLDQTFESVLSDIFTTNFEENEERIKYFFSKYC